MSDERNLGDFEDDRHKPKLMDGAQVLYRSVSLPELIDIFKTGKILGRGNVFNDFDKRKYVFFGISPSEKLLYQGSEIERMIITSLEKHAIHAQFDELTARIEQNKVDIEEEIDELIEDANSDREYHNEKLLDKDNPHTRRAFRLRVSSKILNLSHKLHDMEQKLRTKYREVLYKKMDQEKAKHETMLYTYALIKTFPISGGLHYSDAHGASGMGEEDEYGFRSGQITMDDIDTITLYKNKEAIFSGKPDEVKNFMKQSAKKKI